MPPERSSAGPDDERDGESEATEADVRKAKTRRLRDPVLVLLHAVERALRGIDYLHAQLETLPGRVRFGFGVVTFVSSAYFGETVKRVMNVYVRTVFTKLVTEFAAFSLGVQVILAIVALLVVQMTVASEKLTSIGNIVENMADDDAVTDGGLRRRRVETSGAKAIGGAGLGAIFGGLFGYTSTIFGGMIFGAIVGDLLDEWSAKRRKRRRLQTKVVEYLLRERVFEQDTVERETVRGWFPADDEGFVVEAIEELLRDDDSPVVQQPGGITLVGDSEAVAYLDRNGGRVPSAFAGPNRPPRPSEASE